MEDYAALICARFIEKYPKSAAYRGGRDLRISGWYRLFPEIRDDYEEKTAFLDAVDELCDQGILRAKWKRYRQGDKLEALYLADPDGLYRFAGEASPHVTGEELRRKVEGFTPNSELAAELKRKLLERLPPDEPVDLHIRSAQSSAQMNDFPELAEDMLCLADFPASQAAGLTIRQLSIALFNDSKRVERILPTADRLAAELLGEPLSRRLQLERAYPETSFCLPGILRFADNRSWDISGKSLTLPLISMKEAISWSSSAPSSPKSASNSEVSNHTDYSPVPPAILLLENKESYYSAVRSSAWTYQTEEHGSEQEPGSEQGPVHFSGFVYLGGFPNQADSLLIRLLAESDADLYCFCDLDPAGMLITQHVCSLAAEVSRKPVNLWRMDAETYRKYLPYGYPLADSELRRLDSVTDSRFHPLIAEMKKNRLGVEQEIIPV
ncbi:MAG: DUF2399 domain-containing protein [Spirochaetales bacterium]|nr:DUF2399 domain-containing protein [Spirochaetales bacterium]